MAEFRVEKKIGGKLYKFVAVEITEVSANERAQRYQSEGYKTHIEKIKSKTGIVHYDIYAIVEK